MSTKGVDVQPTPRNLFDGDPNQTISVLKDLIDQADVGDLDEISHMIAEARESTLESDRKRIDELLVSGRILDVIKARRAELRGELDSYASDIDKIIDVLRKNARVERRIRFFEGQKESLLHLSFGLGAKGTPTVRIEGVKGRYADTGWKGTHAILPTMNWGLSLLIKKDFGIDPNQAQEGVIRRIHEMLTTLPE